MSHQSQQQSVVVQNNGCLSGCGGLLGSIFAVALFVGLVVTYWYVAVPVGVLGLALLAYGYQRQRKEPPSPSEGPADPWLTAISRRALEEGFVEKSRNTGQQLVGVPMLGDLVLSGRSLVLSGSPRRLRVATPATCPRRARSDIASQRQDVSGQSAAARRAR